MTDEELQKIAREVTDDALDGDTDDELSMDASNASRALSEVRRLFYGTPLEKVLTDAILVCDVVAEVAQQ